MERKFPRFLYADPQNTKSKGPFIISMLEPRLVCKVHFDITPSTPNLDLESENHHFEYFLGFALEVLESPFDYDETGYGNGYGSKVKTTLEAMGKWFLSQLISGEIKRK